VAEIDAYTDSGNSPPALRNNAAAAAAGKYSQERSGERLTLAERIERMERALNAEELAAFLNVSKITIFKQAKAGRIPSFRIGTCVRFDPRAVSQWLRRV